MSSGTVSDYQPNEQFTPSHKYIVVNPNGKPVESAVSLVRGLRSCGILGPGYKLIKGTYRNGKLEKE